MRRIKTTFSPYVSDVAAFAILCLSVAAVFGVAAMNGKVHHAAYSVTTSGFTAKL